MTSIVNVYYASNFESDKYTSIGNRPTWAPVVGFMMKAYRSEENVTKLGKGPRLKIISLNSSSIACGSEYSSSSFSLSFRF